MKNENIYNWNDVEVHLQGKKIDSTSITYVQEEFQTLLFETQNGVEMKRIPSMEYYLKRKNKYYFRNSFGVKFFIESDEILPLKKGDKITLT